MRIGVYVCHCGSNIAGTVDVHAVAEHAATLPGVAVSREYKYMCSDPGQELIKQDIRDHALERVVVASCSPHLHEKTFRGAVAEGGLNPFFFQMVNIREHVSWVHPDMRAGTAKAKDLVRAAVRRVTAEEMAPLSPEVAADRKRIEVDLAKQTFQCFEDDVKVVDILCSTGPYLRTENGKRIYGTPSGEWAINRKRPTRHMAGDDFASADFFDLPGVPWVSYFHWWGVSIHGTYWHNDYGKPRSHGCINLPPETAKWVFRWSLPRGALSQKPTTGDGTRLIVF